MPPILSFHLAEKKERARPVELRAAAAVGRRREPAISAAFFRHRKVASYALALLRSLSIPPFFHSKRLSFPVENPGNSKRGSQAPFGRLNEGGSREGEKTKSSPPWCRFLWYLSFGQAKERYTPVTGEILRWQSLLRMTGKVTERSGDRSLCGGGRRRTSSGALRHLPRERGRLGEGG